MVLNWMLKAVPKVQRYAVRIDFDRLAQIIAADGGHTLKTTELYADLLLNGLLPHPTREGWWIGAARAIEMLGAAAAEVENYGKHEE